MELVRKAEATLADLYKGAPKLQDSTKETLVKIWPWLALIGGVLQIFSGIVLLNWARAVNDVNDFYASIGVDADVSRFTVWIWISLILLIVEGVLLLLAFPKLQKRQKSGWDLLFIVGLMNVIYAVVVMFSEYRGGFLGFIWNLLISAVIFWLLFAVRDKYKGGSHASTTPHKVVGTKTEEK